MSGPNILHALCLPAGTYEGAFKPPTVMCLMQTRLVVVGWLAVATVQAILSTDRFYNISHWHLSKSLYASSRATFSGFLIMATSNFCLMYHIGIRPPPPPRQLVKAQQGV